MTQHATPQDIMDAFANLADAEKRAIHAAARKHLEGTRFSEPLDLVHEALFLAVEGRRNWPVGLNFAIFMTMTIRSVAYAERTRAESRQTAHFSVEDILEWSETGSSVSHRSAEECAERSQQCQMKWRKISRAREKMTLNDPVAGRVLDALMDERPLLAIRRELGLCASQLDAAKKRVLRALRNTGRL